MVIDTSAILAWLRNKPERDRIVAALEAHPTRRISALNFLEAHIAVRSRELPDMVSKLQRFLAETGAVVVPFDERQARIADMAFLRYGKGQAHPAQLSFGDCAAYALSRLLDEPLLFAGNKFVQTDIKKC